MASRRTAQLKAAAWPFVFLLGVQLIAYLGITAVHWRHATLSHNLAPVTTRWFLVAFLAYLLSIWILERNGWRTLGFIIGAGVVMRLLLLATVPTLSTDVYRYLWDGYVANRGVSPYQFPIDSPRLDYLDHPVRDLANHPWMASPYLPAAQWLFASVTALLPLRPLSMQVAIVSIDLINAGLIVYLLGLAGLPQQRLLIYFWNPLVVVEAAHGAHVDIWMICLTLLALVLAYSKAPSLPLGAISRWLSPLALALATLTKLLPVLLLPVLFWRWHWPQRLLYGGALLLILLPAGLRAGWGLTGPLDGHGLFAALRIYGDQWNFNSGLFHWLEVSLRQTSALPASGVEQWAKRIIGVVMSLILLWTWLRARAVAEPRAAFRLMTVPLMGYVLLTPTFHPWYLLLLLAFLPFLTPTEAEARQPSGAQMGWLAVLPWLYLSGGVFFSYYTYLDPLDLRELVWVRRIEWIPTLALLAFAIGARVWQAQRK